MLKLEAIDREIRDVQKRMIRFIETGDLRRLVRLRSRLSKLQADLGMIRENEASRTRQSLGGHMLLRLGVILWQQPLKQNARKKSFFYFSTIFKGVNFMSGFITVRCRLCNTKWSISESLCLSGSDLDKEIKEQRAQFTCPFGCSKQRDSYN